MQNKTTTLTMAALLFLFLSPCQGQAVPKRLHAVSVNVPPAIDGVADDQAWDAAVPIDVHDPIADIPVTIKAAYTDERLFLLVRFPDHDESRTHKSWIWDKSRQLYNVGNDREDVFIIKWSMEGGEADLSIHADRAYTADIWFWKANRTDPIGYADDKFQTLDNIKRRESTAVTSRSGQICYLSRFGDAGQSAYHTGLEVEFRGELLPRYRNRQPTGSRADVQAKGEWRDGFWTIEFARALNTGHHDDVRFEPDKAYTFGVSRYEIAGRPPNPNLSQPLYGAGDIETILRLVFDRPAAERRQPE